MDADKQVCGREADSQFVELAVEVFSMLADASACGSSLLFATENYP